jgi:DNA polymerase-4
LVNPDKLRKSIGAELTFEKDLSTRFALIAELYKIEKILMERINKAGKTSRTLTLKVKYADFEQITRSKTVQEKITEFSMLHNYSKQLLQQIDISEKKVRLLGLTVSNLENENQAPALQLTLDF